MARRRLYAAVEGYSSANAQTRATTENRWEGGERVRLWISTSISGMPDQDVYPSVDSDGKLITDIDWVSPDEEKGIRGLYPSVRNIDPFSVQADQRDEGYQDSDCMVAPYLRIAVTSPDKTLVFRHVIAKVVVHLKAGNGVTDDELQRATVTFENLACTGGSIDFRNGTVGQVPPDTDRITPNEVTPAADGYVRTVRALLLPQNMLEVRENSHRRKDLLLHPRRRRSELLQWQDVRVPPHRDLGRYRKYPCGRRRRRRRYVASGRVEQ